MTKDISVATTDISYTTKDISIATTNISCEVKNISVATTNISVATNLYSLGLFCFIFGEMKHILSILLLFSYTTKAQLGKEAWHWQFGAYSALDFPSGTLGSYIQGTSAINVFEGCASISNPNTGQLLFYTDGTSAWDRNNNQMPNGFGMIGGYGTSTQAALIVPKPCSSSIYYLISADF
jgi:hypothetical protein